MKTKIVAAFALAFAIALMPATIAAASQGNPHQEEQDGCDHGATGKPCKDDPSPNGKDCEVHGNHGGVNEDHCSDESTTTTTQPEDTTTTTTEPEVTTTTTQPVVVDETTTTTAPAVVTTTTVPVVTQPAPAPVVETPAPVAEVPVPEAPHATCVDAGGFTYETAPGPCPVPALIVDHTAPVPVAPVTELPHTGTGSSALAMFGLLIIIIGASIQILVRPLATN